MNWRQLIHNLASVTVMRIGMAALGFGQFWLLSHRLPAEQLGEFSLLMNTFFLLQALPLLGLNSLLTRSVAASPEDTAVQISNSLAFALPCASLMALLLAVYGQVQSVPGLSLPHLLLGLAMLPTAWTLVAESALVGREALQGIAHVSLAEATARLLGTWVAVNQGWGLPGVFAFFLLGRLGAAAAYLMHPGLPRPSWPLVQGAMLRGYVAEVPTYLGLTLCVAAASRIDVIVLSRLMSLKDVGIYAAASRLYEASLMVSTIAVIVVFPMLSRLFATDRAAFLALLERCLRWGLLLGMPPVLVGMALAPWLVQHVYASALWGAAPVLQLLLLAAWLMALDQLLSTTMMAAQAQRQDLLSMALGLGALVALLVTLTPSFQLPGASLAVVLALALRVGWRLAWAQKQLPLPGLLGHALRAALAAAAGLGTFIGLARHGMPTALMGGWLAHALVAWGIGAWGPTHRADWQHLSQAWLTRRRRA